MAATVFAGRGAALALEELREVALVPEARFDGDLRDELVGRLQQLAGGSAGRLAPPRATADRRLEGGCPS